MDFIIYGIWFKKFFPTVFLLDLQCHRHLSTEAGHCVGCFLRQDFTVLPRLASIPTGSSYPHAPASRLFFVIFKLCIMSFIS